jgi:hypothetical protein
MQPGELGTKNQAAVELAKLRAGKLSPSRRAEIAGRGGKARAEGMSPERRTEIAKKGAAARCNHEDQR